MLRPQSISELWIFFADPWHKNRHRKRRLVNRVMSRTSMRFFRAYSSTAASFSKLPRFLKLYPLIVILLRGCVVPTGVHHGAHDSAAILLPGEQAPASTPRRVILR